jgi:hypothetical protein
MSGTPLMYCGVSNSTAKERARVTSWTFTRRGSFKWNGVKNSQTPCRARGDDVGGVGFQAIYLSV